METKIQVENELELNGWRGGKNDMLVNMLKHLALKKVEDYLLNGKYIKQDSGY